MEFRPRNNKTKIIVIVAVAILFIVLFSMLGMYCAKLYKSKLIADKKQNIELANQSNNKKENKEENSRMEERESFKHTLFPKYSEKAKQEMNNIYNINTKVAFLTFDDGPSQVVTPLILDLLKEENIKATFFVLGSNVKRNPDIVKRAYLWKNLTK